MKPKLILPFTHEYLKSILNYDPDTGNWTWIAKISIRGPKIGSKAGSRHKTYNKIGINGSRYLAHRLAWFYMTEDWPVEQVDHINRIKHDDRWENLRLASHSQNGVNCIRKKKSDLPVGVLIAKGNRDYPFISHIYIDGKSYYLGSFKTPEEAHCAYIKASEFRGEFLPQGRQIK